MPLDKQFSGHFKTQAVLLHQKEQLCQTSLLVWTDSTLLAKNWWWLSSKVALVHRHKWIKPVLVGGTCGTPTLLPWTTENKLVWHAGSAQAISLFLPGAALGGPWQARKCLQTKGYFYKLSFGTGLWRRATLESQKTDLIQNLTNSCWNLTYHSCSKLKSRDLSAHPSPLMTLFSDAGSRKQEARSSKLSQQLG